MIYARARGRVGFICPHCFTINGPKVINWRLARVCCTLGCRRAFRVGFVFALGGPSIRCNAPYNGLFGTMTDKTTNRTLDDAIGDGLTTLEAEYRGPLEFLCPSCLHPNRTDHRSTNHTDIPCTSCHTSYNVGVILWTAPRHFQSPRDWVFPVV